MISVTRKIEFDAAHRVVNHKSKCKMLHGHRYVVEAAFASNVLDEIDMVIDFGEIKEMLGGWIDEHWDHNTILNQSDRALGEQIEKATGQKVYYLEGNPTAERMAEYLKDVVCKKLFTNSAIVCSSIKLYETPNCYASV